MSRRLTVAEANLWPGQEAKSSPGGDGRRANSVPADMPDGLEESSGQANPSEPVAEGRADWRRTPAIMPGRPRKGRQGLRRAAGSWEVRPSGRASGRLPFPPEPSPPAGRLPLQGGRVFRQPRRGRPAQGTRRASGPSRRKRVGFSGGAERMQPTDLDGRRQKMDSCPLSGGYPGFWVIIQLATPLILLSLLASF